MQWLNYHHLLYFWVVAREGGLARASEVLRLRHSTLSSQIHALESALGEKLFTKSGRKLALTDMGQVVFGYADQIFSLGRELVDTVQGRPTGRPLRLAVGIADVVPKLVARLLLEPARNLGTQVRLVCHEDRPERLLADLSLHALDVVISDAPVGPEVSVRAYNHLLGECGVSWFGTRDLSSRYKKNFPHSLDGAPVLLPTENTSLRRSLDHWFDKIDVRPLIVGEFEDSALLKTFGQDGMGLFTAPSVIEKEVAAQHGVDVVGRTRDVRERFYAISVERRLKHPAVVAVTEAARDRLFAD